MVEGGLWFNAELMEVLTFSETGSIIKTDLDNYKMNSKCHYKAYVRKVTS